VATRREAASGRSHERPFSGLGGREDHGRGQGGLLINPKGQLDAYRLFSKMRCYRRRVSEQLEQEVFLPQWGELRKRLQKLISAAQRKDVRASASVEATYVLAEFVEAYEQALDRWLAGEFVQPPYIALW
jgi:hypothetical protein